MLSNNEESLEITLTVPLNYIEGTVPSNYIVGYSPFKLYSVGWNNVSLECRGGVELTNRISFLIIQQNIILF